MTRRHILDPSASELKLRAVLEGLAGANHRALKQLRDAAEHLLDSLLQAARTVVEFLAVYF